VLFFQVDATDVAKISGTLSRRWGLLCGGSYGHEPLTTNAGIHRSHEAEGRSLYYIDNIITSSGEIQTVS
jgi:hypothetical protein